MANISFLHLSDLHIGDKYQKGLISQTKKILFEDIEFILSKLNSLDIVFFTGDFVQKGTKDEFLLLDEFLNDLWNLFNKNDQNPYLLCVPGNHDLERINDLNDPIQKIMSNWQNENIKENYFWKSPNIYHDFIKERFKNYIVWYNNTTIRKPENICKGYLPGDFYTSIYLQDVKLGIVGLNSSFLQLYNGDVKQKIGIYNNQINSLFEENYFEWLEQQNMSILLTHHSSEWFEPKSLKEFNQEIYCGESYIEHLCGHMHKPSYTSTSINGFPSKRLFISPSLFGLEYYGDKSREQRIHGYTAGVYNIELGKISKTIWPRISYITNSGVLKISQNEEFNLDKDSSSLTELLKDSQIKASGNSSKEEPETNISIEENSENLFAQKSYDDSSLVRTLYKEVYSHLSIRHQEREMAVKSLTNHKHCWITTEFGLGEDEFIGSLLNQVGVNPENCFSINCAEVSTIDHLIDAFNKTFSINITKFFDIVNTLDCPLIIFNDLNGDLTKNTIGLKKFIQTIFDFSPDLKIIIISETLPNNRFFEYVELTPLDVPAVKQYIQLSRELHDSFTILEYEKIHRISSGIPFYIDKVIEQLTFRPLSDLGDMEFENSTHLEADNKLPKFLKNEISILQLDDTKQGSRIFSLLSVISLLHNGETFDRIRKYDSTKPFHADDISYLLKNKLIETVQVNSIFENKQKNSESIKIIRAPRIIRDYVSSLLTNEAKVNIYKAACDLYLGSNWRYSIKLIRPKEVELDLIIYQNLQIAIRFLLSNGIEGNNEIEITRLTNVAMSLVDYYKEIGTYKDAISLAEETMLLIKDIEFNDIEKIKIYLLKSLGQSLRMASYVDKSISILKPICDNENNGLGKNERNKIRLSLAYAFKSKNDETESVKYANLIKKNELNKNSSKYLSAESVILYFIRDKYQKINKLNTLKIKAEKFKHNTLIANITLEICKLEKEENKIRQLDKIIRESKNDIYTKVRALVLKADIVLKVKDINEVTYEDLLGLNIAYSYTFYQRLINLMNKCHQLVWQYRSEKKQYEQLLNLFRYSSFVWRLSDELKQEQKYIDELHSNSEFIEWFQLNKNDINCIYYEQRIFALYNNENYKIENVLEISNE